MTIALIGFQGAGKTFLAKKLSSALGLDFLDTDTLIEREYSGDYSCRQIFLKKGAQYFRRLERNVIENLTLTQRQIISFGGGSPLSLVRAKSSTCVYLFLTQAQALLKMQQKGGVFAPNDFSEFYTKRNLSYSNCADVILDALDPYVFSELIYTLRGQLYGK